MKTMYWRISRPGVSDLFSLVESLINQIIVVVVVILHYITLYNVFDKDCVSTCPCGSISHCRVLYVMQCCLNDQVFC